MAVKILEREKQMSLIFQALKKVKDLTSRKPVAPAHTAALASFQFGRRSKAQMAKRTLLTVGLPSLALAGTLVFTVNWWLQHLRHQTAAVLIAPSRLEPLTLEEAAPTSVTTEAPPVQDEQQPQAPAPAPMRAAPGRRIDRTEPPEPAGPKPQEAAAVPAQRAPAAPAATQPAEQTPEIQVAPGSRDPLELAVFYHRSKDYPKAFDMYRRVLELDPLNAAAHNNLGVLYKETGNVQEAIRIFRSAILIDANYDKAHNNLGTALMSAGQNSEAAREFNRALDLNPNNAEAMVNLGIVSGKTGNAEQAKMQYLRALRINRANPEAHYNLALVYEEQGETSSAITHFREFLNRGSGLYPESLIREVEVRIETLSARKEFY